MQKLVANCATKVFNPLMQLELETTLGNIKTLLLILFFEWQSNFIWWHIALRWFINCFLYSFLKHL